MKQRNRVAILNISSTVLLKGIAIFTAPVFMRLLGKTGYGAFSIYSIWTSAIAILFPLETQGTLVNARIEYPEEDQKKYQSSVMSLSVLAFLAFSVLTVVFIGPISAGLKLPWFMILLMLLQAFGTYCVNFLSTKFIYEFKAGWKMILSVTITVTSFLLALTLVLLMPYENRYIGRALGVASTYGIIGIPVCVYILMKGKTFYHKEYWKFCLYLAIPTVFYNISDLILGQTDSIMLNTMMSTAMVGQYGGALKFGNMMFIIFGALNHTWCPFFFEDMKQGRQAELEDRTKNFLELFTVLSVGFLLLCREVYRLYGGPEYWEGAKLIPIFVTSYFINFLCTFPVNYEYYRKKTKAVAVVTVTASLCNLGLNYVLISSMGMVGAALATALSHGLQLALHYGYCRFSLGKGAYPFPVKQWLPYAAGYAAVLILVYLTPNVWFLRWPLGACVGLWELYRIKKRKVLI